MQGKKNTYIHTNKKAIMNQSVSIWREHYVAVLFHTRIIFQSTNRISDQYLFFLIVLPIVTMITYIYQKGDNIKVGTRLVLFIISA